MIRKLVMLLISGSLVCTAAGATQKADSQIEPDNIHHKSHVSPAANLTLSQLTEDAINGDANSKFILGFMCESGLCMKPNPADAQRYYQEAAAAGNTNAMNNLGAFLIKNSQEKSGFDWLQKAYDAGNKVAAANLAHAYKNGLGVTRDYNKAEALYEKAAQSGIPEAKLALAEMYQKGHIVTKDLDKSTRLYVEAKSDENANKLYPVVLLDKVNKQLIKDAKDESESKILQQLLSYTENERKIP